ncbi:MAG: 6-bladed beta-propeller [Bacteroidota bacterium]|nr:6-bladed beta-propeller [Bacteroidota bacterium]
MKQELNLGGANVYFEKFMKSWERNSEPRVCRQYICVFIVIHILLLSMLFGCRNPEFHSYPIEINIEKNIRNIKPLNIGDFNCDISYIPLKNNSILFRSITLIDFSHDLILVSDRKNCFLFDLQGNLISKIGNRGKGPGEYLLVTNIKFGLHNLIYIQNNLHLLAYDLKGNFQRKFKPEINPEVGTYGGIMKSWAPFNDSLFIGQVSNDSGHEKHKAVFFNVDGKTVRSIRNHIFLNIEEPYTSSDNSLAFIYQLEGTIYFKEKMNDTVFLVDDQYEFKPVYFFYHGKYGMPMKERELPRNERKKTYEDCIKIIGIYESTEYLFLNCDFHDHNPAKRSEPVLLPIEFGSNKYWWYYPTLMLGIYNKLSKELVFAEPVKSDNRLTNSGLRNDYDGGPNFCPRKMVNDSTLAMWVDAYLLKEHVASDYFKNSTPKHPEKKKELEKLANSLSENDNPVLILVTFKQ